MNLTPKFPPGRADRKARAYSAEIARLRAAGYSFESIRLALLDAGVAVCQTTVKREARRAGIGALPVQRRAAQPLTAPAGLSEPAGVVTASTPLAGTPRNGKEIAEAFMKGRITNPLMQPRSRDESRRD